MTALRVGSRVRVGGRAGTLVSPALPQASWWVAMDVAAPEDVHGCVMVEVDQRGDVVEVPELDQRMRQVRSLLALRADGLAS